MELHHFPKRFGKYILLDLLNSGGMAEVFLAKVSSIESFQRLIAIKCIRPELAKNEQFSTMFIDEANLAGQLSHANIAQIYELGRYREQLYIAMELVQGHDLRSIVKTARRGNTPVPMGFAAYVVSKAAEALDYAHRKMGIDGKPLNIVHRDVSPQNILVTHEGEVKLVDFGIAKASQRTSETTTGVLKGKFSYMAPEQIRGQEIDHRADIFTLGSVLYELLASRKLFDGDSDLLVMEKVRTAQIPDLNRVLPDVPPMLISALKHALAEKPEERYPNASKLSKALEPLLIHNQTIFGASDAKKFMQHLFGDESSKIHELAAYDGVVEDDSQASEPEVFSAFEGHENQLWNQPTRQLESISPELLRQDANAHMPSRHQLTAPTRPLGNELDDVSDDAFEADADFDESYEADDSIGFDEEPRKALWDEDTEERKIPKQFRGSQPKKRPLGIYVVALIVAGGIGAGIWALSSRDGNGKPPAVTKGPSSASTADHGFVTVKVTGARSASVFIDGKAVGKAPISALRLKKGSYQIKVVERRKGRPNRTRVRKVTITGRSTRKSPQRVVVAMQDR